MLINSFLNLISLKACVQCMQLQVATFKSLESTIAEVAHQQLPMGFAQF